MSLVFVLVKQARYQYEIIWYTYLLWWNGKDGC